MSAVAATALPGAYTPPKPGTREAMLLNIGFFAMVIGMFMAILDIQIVASSIQQIQSGVSASAEEVAWIQTSYLIAEVIGIPLSGLLNRALSMRRLFVFSAAGFTLSSVMCALAWDLNSLVVFRCIQGFLGAAMIPTTMAAAFTLFGPNRSMLQQVAIGMVATLAPSIGPTLGGWITENLSWHWLFLVNVVPGIISASLVWRFIPKQPTQLSLIRNIDIIGLAAMALFLGAFEYVFEEGPAAGWFEDDQLVMWMFLCSLGGIVFFWRAFRQKNPVVDLMVYKDRNFAVGSMVAVVVGFGLFGSVYLTPLFLGTVRGYNSLQIGQIMSVGGVAMFIGGPLAGAIIRRVDPRFVMAFGLSLAAIGLYWNSFLTPDASFNELFWPQALRGAGLIMAMVPSNFVALGTLPPMKLPNATGLITVSRNLGGAVGLAALNTMRLNYTNMHNQEISAGLDPSRPDVQDWLMQTEAGLRAAGVADPAATAIAQLTRRMEVEAAVMTFNNLFLVMAICFAVMLVLVPLLKRPAVANAAAAKEAH
ncbi:MAG TPA: DHA2 family efflux MFS transporter permease subunit [Hyphomonadaceae bacterium]|jgi:DHA2 family multidrug resistance protein|nr:DHA2 family efflux MFS transporter permease subunit [Hyphomonadaceae bacterium]HPI49478.1 DHA2 family efflux MFS transporter permease subunit [Hyphomonadaceae bacterium]